MPPNFRDRYGSLIVLSRRVRSRLFHGWWLAALLGLAAPPARAQTVERPSPTDKSDQVPANPVLTWTYGTTNLLANGGFEDGTNGWIVGMAKVLTLPPPSITIEGTNFLNGNGNYIVQRELTLPADAGGLSFSFQVRTPFSIPSLSLEFLDAVQAPVSLPLTSNYLAGKWRTLGADLSAYAGRAVRLKWIFPFNDAAGWAMDDVRLTPVPAGTEFEVWFGNKATQLARLGRTGLPSWPLRFLPSSRPFYWRVDVINNGQTNIGPAWRFQTAFFSQISQVIADPLPEIICDQAPLRLGLQLADENGFPSISSTTTYNLTPRVEALGEGVPPPPVVVTELSLDPQTAEFQNISGQPLDLSGWLVDVLHTADRTNARARLRIPDGSTLAPGAFFQAQMRNGNPTAWPLLRSPQDMNWSGGSAAVVLRNAASNVVDCVFYQRSVTPPTDGNRPGIQTGVVPRPEWPGFPVTNTPAFGQTIQRVGGRDRNSAADWHFAAATLGKTNANLTLPFERGIGSVPVIAPTANVRTDVNGYFTLPVQFASPASNVVLFATAFVNSRITYSGQSTPFQLADDVCLELTVPAELSETAGTLTDAIRVTIPAPRDTNVIVRLQLPDALAEGVTIPAEIVILAGTTEANGSLSLTDNTELTGPRSLTITASAAGYATVDASLVVQDDERATLRLELPPSLMENSSTQGTLFIDPSPSRPVAVTLSAGAPGRLNFFSGAGVLGPILVPAGSNQVPVGMLALDNQRLEGPTNVTVRAEFANWTPSEATLRIDDDETNTITIQAPAEVEEGDRNLGINVVLGGTVDTNVVLTVTVEPEILVAAEPQATVIAGQRERGIGLNAIGGNETKGDALVTIRASAPGWHDGVTTMLLLDDNPARFAVHVPRGPVQAGETFTLRVRLENINGRALPTPRPDVPTASLVGFNDPPVYLRFCTNCSTPPNLGYDLLFAVDRVSPAVVVRVNADGVMGDSDPLLVWGNPVPMYLLDGVYDEVRDRVVLATQKDQVSAIDVLTGLRHPLFTFGAAYITALADDGETLYLALPLGDRGVSRVNLSTLSPEALWLTSPAGPEATDTVVDLLPLPGQPKSVLVAQRSGEAELTLTAYDDTVPRKESATLAIPAFTGAALLPGLLGGQVFASTLDAVTEFSVTANGVVRVPSAWENHHTYDGGDPAASVSGRGLLLDGQGELFDPALPGWAGSNPPDFFSNRFATDPHTGRIAWQHFQFTDAGGDASFRILDPFTLREVWRSSSEQDDNTQLLWAGPHRWVTQTQGQMQFIKDTAPDPLPATDLAVTASITSRDPQAVRATARWRVENRGTNPAPDVRLTFAFPRADWRGPTAIALLNLSSNAVPTTNGLGGQTFALGDLAPGAVVEVTAELRGFEDGRLDASAFVGSSAADPDPKNNRAVIHTDGLAPALSLRVSGPPVDDGVPLEFPTLSGWNFEVQSARTLNGPWESASTPITGTGGTKATLVPQGGDAVRYWRVVLRLP